MIIGIDARALEGARTGVGRYLINILKKWSDARGHRFILYFKNSIPRDAVFGDNFEAKILPALFGVKSNFIFQHFLLPKAARKDNIDVLFSPSYVLPWRWKGKSVVTIHDVSYEVYPEKIPFLDRFFLKKASRHSAKIASNILTVSDFSKSEIVKYYDIDPEKIIAVHLAPEESFDSNYSSSRCHPERSETERRISDAPNLFSGQGISDNYILSVGSIFNRRHIPEIMEAFSCVAEKFKNLKLLIAGKNHTNPFIDIDASIVSANEKLGREAISRLDYVDEKDFPELYQKAQLTIYLSDYEGFGLPPLESIACGTPAMVSNITVEKEIMGDAAIFIDDNKDTDEICRKIVEFLESEDLQKDLIKKGLKRVNLFSWDECARQTLEVIEKLG